MTDQDKSAFSYGVDDSVREAHQISQAIKALQAGIVLLTKEEGLSHNSLEAFSKLQESLSLLDKVAAGMEQRLMGFFEIGSVN